jgi:hypothetical protein
MGKHKTDYVVEEQQWIATSSSAFPHRWRRNKKTLGTPGEEVADDSLTCHVTK